jgi:hypothetical protein
MITSIPITLRRSLKEGPSYTMSYARFRFFEQNNRTMESLAAYDVVGSSLSVALGDTPDPSLNQQCNCPIVACTLPSSSAAWHTLVTFRLPYLSVLILVPLAVASFGVPESIAVRYSTLEREKWDEMVGQFHSLTDGIKELKLNRWRRIQFFTRQLHQTSRISLRSGQIAANIYVSILPGAICSISS